MKAHKKILLGLGLLLIWGTGLRHPAGNGSLQGRFLTGMEGSLTSSKTSQPLEGRATFAAGAINDEPQTFSSIWEVDQGQSCGLRKGTLSMPGNGAEGQRAVGGASIIIMRPIGDLIIAWAVLLGAERWKNETYRSHGREIIKSIRENLIVQRRGRSM